MYAIASKIKDLPVVSLQTGQTIANTGEPLLDPAKLEVLALRVQPLRRSAKPAVILIRDIRQLATNAILIDHEGEIEDPAEIVRLAPILEQKFRLPGCSVVNESGTKLGKVADYTINLQTHLLQKLYVHRPFYVSLLRQDLIIDRAQIIDVKPGKIVVADASVAEAALAVGTPAEPTA